MRPSSHGPLSRTNKWSPHTTLRPCLSPLNGGDNAGLRYGGHAAGWMRNPVFMLTPFIVRFDHQNNHENCNWREGQHRKQQPENPPQPSGLLLRLDSHEFIVVHANQATADEQRLQSQWTGWCGEDKSMIVLQLNPFCFDDRPAAASELRHVLVRISPQHSQVGISPGVAANVRWRAESVICWDLAAPPSHLDSLSSQSKLIRNIAVSCRAEQSVVSGCPAMMGHDQQRGYSKLYSTKTLCLSFSG